MRTIQGSKEFEPSSNFITIDDIVAFADSSGHELPYEEIQFALTTERLNEADFVVQALAYESDDALKKRRVISMAIEVARVLPILETASIRRELEETFMLSN